MKATVAKREAWIDALPASRVQKPKKVKEQAKYFLWRAISPVHPRMRRAAEAMGLKSERFVQHEKPGRQKFLIGTLSPGKSVRELVHHLVAQGYGNHFLAWRDESQVVSLRLVESFTNQYHLRIFEDGEVRGHYEHTPESYPIKHLFAEGQIDTRDVFLAHLGNFITPAV